MSNSDLEIRMKENYENRYRFYLTRRTPVIIRIDGKAFHSLTAKMRKPFDDRLINCMQETALNLCKEIQGCKLAYTQSDEISLLLTDYDDLDTQAWFDYNLSKLTSVSASLATYFFNEEFLPRFLHSLFELRPLIRAFDARAFNIPKEEVANYFICRQKDAIKNSVTMLAQSFYSDKELDGKSTKDRLLMLEEKGQFWQDLPGFKQRGTCIVKLMENIRIDEKGEAYEIGEHGSWIVDKEPPVFNQKRNYIERWI